MSLFNTLIGATAGMSDNKLYVEDVFSTYLYSGNGSTQTINNGIDLAGEGGMVWVKSRSLSTAHYLFDTARGSGSGAGSLSTNLTEGQNTAYGNLGKYSFGATGFSLVDDSSGTYEINRTGTTYTSWTFRKAPKFFDVVTYTGDGVAGRQIPHSLGCEVGMIVIKRTDASGYDWAVYHKNLTSNSYRILLNTTDPQGSAPTFWNSTTPSSNMFTLGTNVNVNANGASYVAYLFAHDPSADGIIQCGSYVGNGSATGPTVTLGWEPQYVMIKAASAGSLWHIYDVMRGWTDGGRDAILYADFNASEDATNTNLIRPLPTGFQLTANYTANNPGVTYIYLAIRRPMKVPTSGTEVYNAVARTGTGATAVVTGVGFTPELVFVKSRGVTENHHWFDKLRGATRFISSNTTENEYAVATTLTSFDVDGVSYGANTSYVNAVTTYINHFFRRAKGFFDVVCYTGTGVARTVNHNLGVVPEMMIVKMRTPYSGYSWFVKHKSLSVDELLFLQATDSIFTDTGGVYFNHTQPTSTVFSVGTNEGVNYNTGTYVSYLFASCPGVSKVGSYTGNGTSQTINCGFSTGARFILIKRTDATGDWYVWDTARGIVSANDPHLSLNTTAAEVTTDDSVDPDTSGFVVNQNTATNINVSGGSYIFLAIA